MRGRSRSTKYPAGGRGVAAIVRRTTKLAVVAAIVRRTDKLAAAASPRSLAEYPARSRGVAASARRNIQLAAAASPRWFDDAGGPTIQNGRRLSELGRAQVDDVEAAAPDQDTRDDGEEVKTVVFVPPNDLGAMQAALQGAGHDCVANLVHEPIPGTLVKCSEEDLEKNLRVLDKMVEVEDVDTVEHNIDFS